MTDDIFPCRTETEDSASLFHELRRRVNATPGGRHAALALDTLGELMNSKPRREAPALTWSTLEPLIVPLGDLAHRYEGTCWCRLVLALLDLIPVSVRKPALVLQLALYAPAEVRPVLLAEYWHLLMIGARHDRLFALSVALDVWGHALSTPSSCLAETFTAAARRIPNGSPWVISPSDSPAGSPASALMAVASIPGEFDFVRGWCLVQLNPWLRRAGLGKEVLKLAQGLSHRFGAQFDTLEHLASRTGQPTAIPAHEKAARGKSQGTVHRLYVSGEATKKRFPVYLGRPGSGYHPLHFQNAWTQAQFGVAIELTTMTELQAL